MEKYGVYIYNSISNDNKRLIAIVPFNKVEKYRAIAKQIIRESGDAYSSDWVMVSRWHIPIHACLCWNCADFNRKYPFHWKLSWEL